MRNFAKHFVAFLGVCLSLAGFLWLMEFLTVDDSSSFRRFTMHDYYEQDHIDTLFLGSSQALFSVDPGIMDEQLGKNTFILGTTSQRLDTSYMLLKDCIERYHPDHVYVYLGYRQGKYTREKYSDLSNIYPATDYMKPTMNRLQYLLNVSGPDHYANTFLRGHRDWQNIFNPAVVSKVLKTKLSGSYREYDYKDARTREVWYAGKGHSAGKVNIEEGAMLSTFAAEVDTSLLTDAWKKNILKIIDFCRGKGIVVTFFAPPLSSCLLTAQGNYDEFIGFVKDFLADEDAEYLDFSLLREEYWPDTTAYYQDDTHLNQTGAEHFSRIFADYINGKVTEEELFCDSVAEKIASAEPAFYGIFSDKDAYRLVANRDEGMLFKVQLEKADGSTEELQDYDENRLISLPEGTEGTLHVMAKYTEQPSYECDVRIKL